MNDFTQMILAGREFTKLHVQPEFQSDQDLNKPQPPLVKEKMTDRQISLPMDFTKLALENDILALLQRRISRRLFTEEGVTLAELSFLLWATQGIKGVRGNHYATLRPVPCGGGRHEFETYLVVRNVTGLEPGLYHYLPMTNEIELLAQPGDLETMIANSVLGQRWAAKANVVFYWAMVPYRAEWRYGIYTHRIAMVDVGHVAQNLYIACEALGLGTCAIGAFDRAVCGEAFGLDEAEEYVVLCAPVGTVKQEDKDREQAGSIAIHDSKQ
jgi:SagB-type dehydrogenase family enzyme